MQDLRSATASQYKPFGKSVYSRMSALAAELNAADLGQGAPDDTPPPELLAKALEFLRSGNHQYQPPAGIPELRQAVAEKTRRFYDVSVDPDSEIVVTSGAEEGLSAAFMGLCEPGDEVVTLEPFYIPYSQKAAMAGATLRSAPLTPGTYRLDEAALRRVLSPRSRLLVLNSPGNPSGQVFTRAEMETVAAIASEHDLVVLCDDVYEHLCYDGHEHVNALTIGGLRERAICFSSVGKTFAATGWRMGYAVGAPHLVWPILVVRQQMSFCNPQHLQRAAAWAIGMDSTYYAANCARYQERRDLLCDGLETLGFRVQRPEGGYFCSLDIRPFGYENDVEFCEDLVRQARVAAVPMSPGWKAEPVRHLARLCFAKKKETIELALERLDAWKRSRG